MTATRFTLEGGKRLRTVFTVAVAIGIAVGLGYAYSYEPDEEAVYQRAATEQQARVRDISRHTDKFWPESHDSVLEARAAAAAAAEQAVDQQRRLACGDARVAFRSRCLRFLIDSVMYTVEIEPSLAKDSNGVRRVRVHDDSARVIYNEDINELVAADGWMGLSVQALDDPGGQPRALLFTYVHHGQGTEVSYRIFPPRRGRFPALTPRVTSAGLTELPKGSPTHSLRLFEGHRFIIWKTQPFHALIPYLVDSGCEPGGPPCVALMPDSITGAAKFGAYVEGEAMETEGADEDAESQPAGPSVTIQMFANPTAKASRPVAVKPGYVFDVIEGATARAGGGSAEHVYEQAMKDGWLHVRVDGQAGWVRGAETFAAIYEVPPDFLQRGRPQSR